VQSDNKLLSASRDASAIVWKKGAKDNTWEAERSIPDSQGKFISALTGIDLNGQGECHRKRTLAVCLPLHSSGAAYFVLGSASGTISLHAVESDNSKPDRQLKGHSKNVCALDCGPNTAGEQVLLSGSWDQ
jgi:WD40 repeat protein